MNYNQIITMILEGVLVPSIVYGILLLRNYLAQKMTYAAIKGILDQATNAAILAVKDTSQVYVDAIKGTPDWSAKAQREAFERALHTAQGIISEEGLALLETATGDANKYLTTAIEAAVQDYKN